MRERDREGERERERETERTMKFYYLLQLTVPGITSDGSSGPKVQPIKLSLSLNPQVSVAAGNLTSSQGTPVQGKDRWQECMLTTFPRGQHNVIIISSITMISLVMDPACDRFP